MSTGSFEYNIRKLAEDGFRLHLWRTKSGAYQANMAEPGSNAWTCVTMPDPIDAIAQAVRQRLTGAPGRRVEVPGVDDDLVREVAAIADAEQAAQIDIEEALQNLQPKPLDLEDLLS